MAWEIYRNKMQNMQAKVHAFVDNVANTPLIMPKKQL
jgi:hypothetical protein